MTTDNMPCQFVMVLAMLAVDGLQFQFQFFIFIFFFHTNSSRFLYFIWFGKRIVCIRLFVIFCSNIIFYFSCLFPPWILSIFWHVFVVNTIVISADLFPANKTLQCFLFVRHCCCGPLYFLFVNFLSLFCKRKFKSKHWFFVYSLPSDLFYW